MRVAVVGGRLQGLEALYLAKKAGWETVLIDRNSNVPALNFCDRFFQLNVSLKEGIAVALDSVDLIIPAFENRPALGQLAAIAAELKIPIAIDLKAYDVSASKSVSDRLFAELGVPAPRPWPECAFPMVAKPIGSSGSEGVVRLSDELALRQFQVQAGAVPEEWVIQEYLEGPSYSIEIIGCRGRYWPLQVTGLEMDDIYDCKRVLAPSDLNREQCDQFAKIAVQIAEKLELNGIMDVEVILNNNRLQVLEIDARLPSQTPTAVYHSTGINMLELLADCFIPGRQVEPVVIVEHKAVIFEHVVVSAGRLAVSGEHAVSTAGQLKYCEGFFGADEALTDYTPGAKAWMATLIVTADNAEAVWKKRELVVNQIMKELRLTAYSDPLPQLTC
jgi:pyrrolysine biosynthesis protein PylC